MSNDNNDKSGHDNRLADQLADLDIDVSDDKDHKEKPDSRPHQATPDRDTSRGGGSEQLSDEELFRQAVEEIDPDDVPSGDDPGPPAESTTRPTRSSSSSPAEDKPSETSDSAGTADVKSDQELFEEAVENIDPAEVYDAKFRGQAGTSQSLPEQRDSPESGPTGSDGEDELDEQQAREKVQQLRQEAMFHKAVADVDPIEGRDKYHRSRRKRRTRRDDDDGEDALLTPSLPQSGEGLHYVPPLDDTQKAMLQRHERYSKSDHVPQLNVRGMTRGEALDKLRSFMDRHHGEGTRFVRLVPGRGVRSETEPVLKPSMLRWLEGPGRSMIRGYVPERIQGGDYGSLIVEFEGNR